MAKCITQQVYSHCLYYHDSVISLGKISDSQAEDINAKKKEFLSLSPIEKMGNPQRYTTIKDKKREKR